MDFRALKGGISGIRWGDVDEAAAWVAPTGVVVVAEELWLLLRFRNGGISGIWIGCETAFNDALLLK